MHKTLLSILWNILNGQRIKWTISTAASWLSKVQQAHCICFWQKNCWHDNCCESETLLDQQYYICTCKRDREENIEQHKVFIGQMTAKALRTTLYMFYINLKQHQMLYVCKLSMYRVLVSCCYSFYLISVQEAVVAENSCTFLWEDVKNSCISFTAYFSSFDTFYKNTYMRSEVCLARKRSKQHQNHLYIIAIMILTPQQHKKTAHVQVLASRPAVSCLCALKKL